MIKRLKKIKFYYKVLRFTGSNIRQIIEFSKIAPDDFETENVPNLTVFEAKSKLDNEELFVIDIRGPRDFKDAKIVGSYQQDIFTVLENLGTLHHLSENKDIGVICYGGGGSKTVTRMLMDKGFDNVWNIEGGILRYALDVDNTILEAF